jgi:RNA polymerase sigma-70 factor (ECF subfamily)
MDAQVQPLPAERAASAGDDWLLAFHAGDRRVLEQVYREHFGLVDARVGRTLRGADRETVVHEIFYKLLSSEETRAGFRGGSLAAWLSTVASHAAIDHARRAGRERPLAEHDADAAAGHGRDDAEDEIVARLMLERFRQALPVDWLPVFEARFVHQLTQREAAAKLGISRTTLAYRELRVRHILRRLADEELP